MGKVLCDKLYQREWLHEKYVIQGLSRRQIAALLGVSEGSVKHALKKLGIPCRNLRDASLSRFRSDGRHHDDHFVLDLSALSGTLLGDASLNMNSRSSEIGAPALVISHSVRDGVDYQPFVT